MKILIDGDGCYSIEKTVDEARKKGIEVHVYCDTKHVITNDYASVHIVDWGRDAVDLRLLNDAEPGDIILTNDGGLASLACVRAARAMDFDGRPYTELDLCRRLDSRYFRARKKRGSRKQMNRYAGKSVCYA